jgi:hypothetical protein
MVFDLQKARKRLLQTIHNPDDSERDRSAIYLDVATGALNRIEALEAALVVYTSWAIMMDDHGVVRSGAPREEDQAIGRNWLHQKGLL